MKQRPRDIAKKTILKIGSKTPAISRVMEERDNLRTHLDNIQKEQKRIAKKQNNQILLPIDKEDLFQVSSTSLVEKPRTKTVYGERLKINWVIPPLLSHEGGGHTTLLSIVGFLESKGHECKIYHYDPQGLTNLEKINAIAKSAFPDVKSPHYYGTKNMDECDAIFATSWETAYPVFNQAGQAKKFYLVQDYEPYFFPAGTMSNLAEHTYNMGFYGITAGKWLQKKIHNEHNMEGDFFDFSADRSLYKYVNNDERNKVLFYCQPFKPRRGFELGIYALELFNKAHPEYEILMLGTDSLNYKLPFKYKNLGAVPRSKLNSIYNQCAAALIISFTNMSLLPLEVMAAGCIPVVNDGENNRLVSNNPNIVYTKPFAKDLADSLCSIVERENLSITAKKSSDSVLKTSWIDSYEKVNSIILREATK